MSSAAVAAPFQAISYHSHSHAHNMTTSPPPPKHNKPNRARNNNQYPQSDSNLPSQAQTPKPKKQRPRQNDHRTASGSDIPKSNRSKSVNVNKSPIMSTPAKAAYAGPTFHASPAASALPVPKFFSKSVPPATTDNSLQAKLESEPTAANVPSPATEAAAPAAPLAREKSPLDIFFNADRVERQSHSKHPSPSLPRRVTPPDAKGLFMMEMDNSNSPAHTRSPAPASSQSPRTQPGHVKEEDDKQAYTQSLKDFLKLQQPSPSRPSPVHPQSTHKSFATPQQQRAVDQDPSLLYGNRNLSPMFQAARNPSPYGTPQRDSPSTQSQRPFDPRAYLESHAVQQSPFVSPRPNQSFPPAQSQQSFSPRVPGHHRPADGVPVSASPQHPHYHQQPPDQSPSVKDMEAKLRGMLKLC